MLVVRVRPAFRIAVVLGVALAALTLAITARAAPGAESRSSSLGAAAAFANVEFRHDSALLAPGRQTQPGVWAERRLPTHPSGVVALLAVATLFLALARAGAARFYPVPPALSLAWRAGGPRGPPLFQLT